jgi:ABC-2 type transport system ATP-binding protein
VPLAIQCQDLWKIYPGKPPVEAVRGLNLEVRTGECFGLLGPNGAGKTTTIEILEGLLTATRGSVEILGRRWGTADEELKERLGISLQETKLPEKLTVRETLTLFRSFYRQGDLPQQAMQRVGLEDKADTWVKKLSGGQKQRLGVACAIVGRPELLFLDEPTTGLDPQSRRQLWGIIHDFRRDGGTVLLTTHYMDEAERLCDRVAIVDQGQVIACDSPRQLILSLGGEHVIELGLAAGDALPANQRETLVAQLRALPAIRESRWDGPQVHLTVNEPHIALPTILAHLQSNGWELSQLGTRHASLEDVFLALTGRHLAAEAEAAV